MDSERYICMQCSEETEISASSVVEISLEAQHGKHYKKCRCSWSCESVDLTSVDGRDKFQTAFTYVVVPGHKPLSLIFKKILNTQIVKNQSNINSADFDSVASHSSHSLEFVQRPTDLTFEIEKQGYSPSNCAVTKHHRASYTSLHSASCNRSKHAGIGQQSTKAETDVVDVDQVTSRSATEPSNQTRIDGTKSWELKSKLLSIHAGTQSVPFPSTDTLPLESILGPHQAEQLSQPATGCLQSIVGNFSAGSMRISFYGSRTRLNLTAKRLVCKTYVGLMEFFLSSFSRSDKSLEENSLSSLSNYSKNLIRPNTHSLLDIITEDGTERLRESLELKCRAMILKAISEIEPTQLTQAEGRPNSETVYSSQMCQLEVNPSDATMVKNESDFNKDDKTMGNNPLALAISGQSTCMEAKNLIGITNRKILCAELEDNTRSTLGSPEIVGISLSNATARNDDILVMSVTERISETRANCLLTDWNEVHVNSSLTGRHTTEIVICLPVKSPVTNMTEDLAKQSTSVHGNLPVTSTTNVSLCINSPITNVTKDLATGTTKVYSNSHLTNMIEDLAIETTDTHRNLLVTNMTEDLAIETTDTHRNLLVTNMTEDLAIETTDTHRNFPVTNMTEDLAIETTDTHKNLPVTNMTEDLAIGTIYTQGNLPVTNMTGLAIGTTKIHGNLHITNMTEDLAIGKTEACGNLFVRNMTEAQGNLHLTNMTEDLAIETTEAQGNSPFTNMTEDLAIETTEACGILPLRNMTEAHENSPLTNMTEDLTIKTTETRGNSHVTNMTEDLAIETQVPVNLLITDMAESNLPVFLGLPITKMIEDLNSHVIATTELPVNSSIIGKAKDLENVCMIERLEVPLNLPTRYTTTEVLVFLPTGDITVESPINSPTKVTTEIPEFSPTRNMTEIVMNCPRTKVMVETSECSPTRNTTGVHVNSPNQPDNVAQGPSLEQKYLEHSPLLFSEEEDESYDSEVQSSLLDEIRTAEQTRLCKLRELVSAGGVLPPPSVTMPQLTAYDILGLIQENTKVMATLHEPTAENCQEMRLTCASRLRQVKECVWPDVKQCCYPDIYYNNGTTSEEFESLCLKYKERFVGNETASSCNVWFTLGPSSGKKRKRVGGPSPGRRLSHLACRRRQMFSKDNLFNISAANRELAAAERRKIHLDKKKVGLLQRPRSVLVEQGHNSDQVASGSNPTAKVTHKRALFQSPDESQKYTATSKLSLGSNKNSGTGTNRSFKRALFCGASESYDTQANPSLANPQYVRQDLVSKKRPPMKHMPVSNHERGLEGLTFNSSKRKLVFGNDLQTGASTSSTASRPKAELKGNGKVLVNRTTDSYASFLDCVQRRKLMWAFSQALGSVGIGTMHASFRPSVQALGRMCRTPIFDAIRRQGGHSSEIMLQVAMEHVAQVVGASSSAS